MFYKKLAEYIAENITGVAGSFMMSEDFGSYHINEVHSTEDCQQVVVTHTHNGMEKVYEVSFRVKSHRRVDG
jgi:hypothetical protein